MTSLKVRNTHNKQSIWLHQSLSNKISETSFQLKRQMFLCKLCHVAWWLQICIFHTWTCYISFGITDLLQRLVLCSCISWQHTTTRRTRPHFWPSLCRLSFLLFLRLSVSVSLPVLYIHFSLLAYSLSLTTDIQKKQPGEDCTSKPIQSTGSSQSPVFSSETSSSSSQSLLSSPPSSSEQPSTEEPSPTFPSTREGKTGQPATLASENKKKNCWWRMDCLFFMSLNAAGKYRLRQSRTNSHRLVGARTYWHQESIISLQVFVSFCGPFGQNMTRIKFAIVSCHWAGSFLRLLLVLIVWHIFLLWSHLLL